MREQFVPYELALKLKELGFKDKGLGFSYMRFKCEGVGNAYVEEVVPNYLYDRWNLICIAPLWQEVFDWFTRKGLHSYIEGAYPWFRYYINTDNVRYEGFKHLKIEEARQACLEKLIKLIENEK